MLNNLPPITYHITSTGLARLVQPINYYCEQQYDYVITSSWIRDRTKSDAWKREYPISWQFYHDIDNEFELIKQFEPNEYNFGPIIKIYKIK